MKSPFLVLYAVLLNFSFSLTGNAQVFVYDHSDRNTLYGNGEASKLIVSGHWIFDAQSTEVLRVILYPSTKSYSSLSITSRVLRAVGPKSTTYSVIGYGFYLDPELENFLDYASLVGVDKTVKLGGRFGSINLPTSMSGPAFSSRFDAESGNTLRQGTQTLKFNSKWTQLYNSLEYTPEQVQADLILYYIQQGFRAL
jgi:hypothetical protein